MRKIAIHQVDTFTDRLFGGNPAAVVGDANNLTDKEMQNIAQEMNLSETAFVLAAIKKGADIRIRYFTPTTEVKFCGHATIATLHTLAQNSLHGLDAPGKNMVRIETAAGMFDMSVTNTAKGTEMSFVVPAPDMQEYHLQGPQFSDAFGVEDIVDPAAKILVEAAPQKFVFIPVVSLEALRGIRYDTERVKERFGDTNTIIFCFYSRQTINKESDVHARSFGPLIGLEEDPFTGAVQAGLFLSARRNGYVGAHQQRIRSEQGHIMGRPGFAEVSQTGETISITANAVKVFSAEMEL